ncbi:unnamed protein product [Cladocopium goreaui]|uniref:3-methyl-2-oxobutanoate dehydrogenase (2-methylpropanoyl-transferring) n=1 Tax=Cladocopium goreaui TaxID=2562237 RepID=A0A9P1G4Z5_9DINO|nr:unnamed protein product [Cladocopium goreaui]
MLRIARFDQIVNEAAKYRPSPEFRVQWSTERLLSSRKHVAGDPENTKGLPEDSLKTSEPEHCGSLTIRMPAGAVGHGGLYHSQSPEAYFTHCPGLNVVVPRGPRQAKGLLLAAVRSPDPTLVLEPKVLYRQAVEDVPVDDFELPIGKAEVLKEGTDVTLIGWGNQVNRLLQAAQLAEKQGISCEVLDLQSLVPWDEETVIASVEKTGRCVLAHEAPKTCGFGAELAATLQDKCFLKLEALGIAIGDLAGTCPESLRLGLAARGRCAKLKLI